MKKILILAYAVFAVVAQARQTQSMLVSVPVRSVHVPLGFDSNDEAEVMVVALLPDTCHRRPFGDVRVGADNTIYIDMKATKVVPAQEEVCIKAIVPVLVSVPTGKLLEGVYNVKVNNGTDCTKMFNLKVVAPSSESIDNFTYANVVAVERDLNDNKIYLEGSHPSSCMEFDQVKLIPNERGDTIAILPIVKQTEAVCDQLLTPFKYEVILPNAGVSDVVLHVRKIDGRAINLKL